MKNIKEAFTNLLNELENAASQLVFEAETAARSKDFEKMKEIGEKGEKLKNLIEKLEKLQMEWEVISNKIFQSPEKETKVRKFKKGLKTEDRNYYIPILESLIELGGSARTADVLEKVYEKMKHRLNEYDKQPVPSDSHEPRWKNSARWVRFYMIKVGLLADDSPRGIWEITQKGRAFYEKYR